MPGSDRYAVFGNPVRHSKSPQIHAEFAAQCQQKIQYRAVKVAENGFSRAVKHFFMEGGKGLNVTLPFKEEAFAIADVLSDRACRAAAVNTLYQDESGVLRGDTTDGVGLLRDMVVNLEWKVADRKVLILGAGGAVRGVLEPLLSEGPAGLVIANRTVEKAQLLVAEFSELGMVSACEYSALQGQSFDIIVNGTSASLRGELLPLPDGLLNEHGRCYDMVYGTEPTVFMRWAAEQAAWAVSDGLGMLVEQAAESFYLWRGVRPDTGSVIAQMRTQLQGQAA
ncbi:MAG: shikimate dehydrogenase [Halieaceae bacterium]|jgi:shikimate dehydrogenase